jgi:multiple sugar transport system substrate-binding protein
MKPTGHPRGTLFRIAVRKYPPFEDAIRAQWEAFEAQTQSNLTLALVPLELPELENALLTSKGMSSGDWDVCFTPTDWIASMRKLECAVDLQPFLESDPPEDYPHGWHASLLRLQQIRGSILGVPYHDGPECLIYRRDLFENTEARAAFRQRLGRKLTIPRTWDEFHEVARFFQDPRKRLYGTAFSAFPEGHNSVYDFLLQLWSRGGHLIAPSGDVRFSTREAESAITFYREILSDNSAVHPECRLFDSVAAGLRFAAGEIAMMINWFGFATFAHTANDSAVRGLVDVAKIPSSPGCQSISLNVYWILAIAVGSPHREISWKFLRHTLTPGMDRLTTTLGAIGCRRSTWSDSEINLMIPFYRRMESLHDRAREIPQRDDWPKIAAIIDELVTSAIGSSTPTRELLRAADESYTRS